MASHPDVVRLDDEKPLFAYQASSRSSHQQIWSSLTVVLFAETKRCGCFYAPRHMPCQEKYLGRPVNSKSSVARWQLRTYHTADSFEDKEQACVSISGSLGRS